jgi:hypothetical protein
MKDYMLKLKITINGQKNWYAVEFKHLKHWSSFNIFMSIRLRKLNEKLPQILGENKRVLQDKILSEFHLYFYLMDVQGTWQPTSMFLKTILNSFHKKRNADRLHGNTLRYITAAGRLVRSNIQFTF